MMTGLKRFLRDEEATTATEYAIMIALLVLAIVAGASNTGTRINARFNASNTVL